MKINKYRHPLFPWEEFYFLNFGRKIQNYVICLLKQFFLKLKTNFFHNLLCLLNLPPNDGIACEDHCEGHQVSDGHEVFLKK